VALAPHRRANRDHFADDRFGRVGTTGHHGLHVVDLDPTGHRSTPFLTRLRGVRRRVVGVLVVVAQRRC
jgi:hypothetical protein